ncbi:BPL/LPL catalytic domain-containing protein [Aphelenchoides besseyi]|nr:BPL/LPL catalytic domain-containing protein [Aphelenchoides besseyi]KAI6209674.1 BPL/LPL catalytic domain-containing protein [Aphelenchoides besseyi]
MLLFAWSLVSSAIHYARRRRLLSILQSYIRSSSACQSALVCRRISFKPKSNQLEIEGRDLLGARQTTSEPFLDRISWRPVVIYRTEDSEILSTPPVEFDLNEWSPAFFSENRLVLDGSKPRVILIIRVVPLKCSKLEPNSSNSTVQVDNSNDINGLYSIDAVANRIACHRNRPNEMLYETNLSNFYNIVIYWTEGILTNESGQFAVTDISTIHLPDLINGQYSNWTGLQSTTSSCSSLAFHPAFSISNCSREVINSSTQARPLLEVLYQDKQTARSVNSANYPTRDSIHFVREIGFQGLGMMKKRAICASDTFINLFDINIEAETTNNLRRLRKDLYSIANNKFRMRSCSPSISSRLPNSTGSFKHRPTQWIENDSNRSHSVRYSSPPVPLYFRHRRTHYDSEPSTSSAVSTTRSSIRKPCEAAYSNTLSISSEEMNTLDENSLDDQEKVPTKAGDLESKLDVENNHIEETTTDLNSSADTPRDKVSPLKSEVDCRYKKQRSNPMSFGGMELPQYNTVDVDMLTDTRPNEPNTFLDVDDLNFLAARKTRRRVASLTPHSNACPPKDFGVQVGSTRRRSLSPLSLSLLANYGSKEAIDSISSQNFGSISTDAIFQRNRANVAPKRRFHNMPNGEATADESNGVHVEDKPRAKPPTVLIYTGDQPELFQRIATSLRDILPHDVYSVSHLSTRSLRHHPWIDENTACLLIADTKPLDDQAWTKLQSYFVHAGKILFVCQNSLFASLTNCDSVKKQMGVLKSAFGRKAAAGTLGKDFESFMKKALKTLDKCKEVTIGIRINYLLILKAHETFHARDAVGGYKYSVVFHKKADQPLLLYMENSEHKASALFSDLTTEQLLSTAGRPLIAEAMSRLGIRLGDGTQLPPLTRAYLICHSDRLIWNMEGLTYGDEIGNSPRLFFRSSEQMATQELELPKPTRNLACHLNQALPNFDGIVITADTQIGGIGRGGNQWLSPKGCAMFSFDFNIPVDSELGSNIVFLQHILAVSIVDAVLSLVDISDFPLKIKWPNDIYYGRSYKMGGIIVSASCQNGFMRCIIKSNDRLGAGINVANSHPTVCVNDMLPADSDQMLCVEETLAEIMNKFEFYVNMFVNRGKQDFIATYVQHWLHTREEVTVIDEESGSKDRVIIRGLDPNGYLEVRSKSTGRVFSVHDDGNTFDMMKGLIRPKMRA